ncbi:MAG: DDE-type integrase/transposase/recombinase, partial [Clostridiaceae bacterium]|nr:DDE-type integrase/transposase/recombinase [Clostridiaceae bacterium]
MVIEGLVKAKRAYYTKYNRIVDYKLIKELHESDEKWCTDVTEIKVPTTGQKLYISPVLDLYDRYPVGFAISERNDTALTNATLEMAHNAYPNATPLYHS